MRVRPLLALAAVAAVVFAVGDAWGHGGLLVALKPVPVWALARLQRRAPDGTGKGYVGAGLLLSGLGDVMLELPDGFVPGLLAFLLGHVAYVLGFWGRAPEPRLLLGVPFAAYAAAMVAVLYPGLGDLVAPVGVYGVVLGAMAWRAACLRGRAPDADAHLALVGALLFVASDTCLAVNKFLAPFPGAGPLILATYWAGQLGIAASTGALRVDR